MHYEKNGQLGLILSTFNVNSFITIFVRVGCRLVFESEFQGIQSSLALEKCLWLGNRHASGDVPLSLSILPFVGKEKLCIQLAKFPSSQDRRIFQKLS